MFVSVDLDDMESTANTITTQMTQAHLLSPPSKSLVNFKTGKEWRSLRCCLKRSPKTVLLERGRKLTRKPSCSKRQNKIKATCYRIARTNAPTTGSAGTTPATASLATQTTTAPPLLIQALSGACPCIKPCTTYMPPPSLASLQVSL